jgi:hypothetical protein
MPAIAGEAIYAFNFAPLAPPDKFLSDIRAMWLSFGNVRNKQ